MTTIYFIRHAQADNTNRDGRNRPLTEKGMSDRALVTEFLRDKKIDAVISSPFKRAVDTVAPFAEGNGFEIELIEDFRERRSDIDFTKETFGFEAFMERQWADFSYTYSDGECLAETQNRNIAALNAVLKKHGGKNIVIGTHGTALSTIINYYDPEYGFKDFMAMADILPWVARMDFNGDGCISIEKIDLFKPVTAIDFDSCVIHTAGLGALKAYKFVVVFARYQNKWLYCRAKERDCFETAGGHVEDGETPLEAAKRELYEETGAVKFDIEPAFDYSARFPNFYNAGQVYFAQIHELGDIPDYEMAEVRLFDTIPGKMRFPKILPILYERMQMWLNLQSAKDEIWDVYDSERNLTGRTQRRADPMREGDYHLVVHVWLVNGSGEFLISKRAPNKGYPNMWECTGGSAVSGDDSVAAAIREVKEEIGLDAKPENGRCIFTITGGNDICDVWLFKQDFDINDVVLQENETTAAKYAAPEEIRRMIKNDEFIGFRYIEDLFEKAVEGEPRFFVEETPRPDTIKQLVSIISAYAGEYFTNDFAGDVRTDAPFQRLCYLKNGDEIAAAIMFTCLDGAPHITAMVTKREHKNKGYGKRLMEQFTRYVSRLGFRAIELYAWSEKTKPVCASTQAFYRSVGFRVESEHMGLWAPEMVTVKMKKTW